MAARRTIADPKPGWAGLFDRRTSSGELPPALRRMQWGVAIGATALAVLLHLIYLFQGGGLWRDEVSSVQLATMPGVGEMWRSLDVPALFPALLRGWCAIGLGHTDMGLRIPGFIIGLALIGTLWLNARIMGYGFPLISLGLLAANLTFVRWGDSVRAYGLACLLIVLTVGQIWALIQRPGRRQFLLAALTAVLSVQCLYQNAFLLAAACTGGCLVCLFHRNRKTAGLVFLVGLCAAVSLLPYLGRIGGFANAWKVLRSGFEVPLAWTNFSLALGSPWLWLRWIWLGLLVLTAAIAIGALNRKPAPGRMTAGDVSMYAAVSAATAVVAFIVFLALAKLQTQPWYYLPLLTFVAACMDAALAYRPTRSPGWRIFFAGLMLCVSFPGAVGEAGRRQTNVDLAAKWLRDHAQPQDLIVVYPWYCGVTFNYYYHGAAPWTTLPALADNRLHRYDLLMEKMSAADPIQDVQSRVEHTLGLGRTVWVLGHLPLPDPDETTLPELPPAPDGPHGWADEPYTYVWGRKLEQLLRIRAQRAVEIIVDSNAWVNIYESTPLFRVDGRGLSPVPELK